MTEPTGMTGPEQARPPSPPGSRFAMSVVHPRPPTLRVRYRQGVLVTPQGFPDWPLCARALVELPAPDEGLTLDEVRVLDVLAANAAMARAATQPDGDPLWTGAAGSGVAATPPGWCWAHLPSSRRLALVPVDLHGSYRHAGGIRTLTVAGRGLRTDPAPVPVRPATGEPVPDDVLDLVERLLGWPLPPAYRRHLAATNGAGPAEPGVLPGLGLVADQPLFGLARDDAAQDLTQVWQWMRDRLTVDFDSIWYWDDDDPRDDDAYGPERICADLLHRCADTIDDFFALLTRPPEALVAAAARWVDGGLVTEVRDSALGAGLPPRLRAPWQPRANLGPDPLTKMFEAR
jgi:hypothetical protein